MADIGDERDLELEEGECSDSEDEQQFISTPAVTSYVPNSTPVVSSYVTETSAYRSRIPQIVINSDESDDECPSAWKKPCSPSSNNSPSYADVSFVNPLLSGKQIINSSGDNTHRRKNNIWGSVLTEQVLSNEVKLFGVDSAELFSASRDVESYDFRKAKEDMRPDLEINPDEADNSGDDIFNEVVDLEKETGNYENHTRKHHMETEAGGHESRKRKWHSKKFCGHRSYNKHMKRNLGVTANDDVSDVVAAILKGLSEPNVELFTRIVETIGNELALKLFYLTEDTQEHGGMMTNDGFRRRTPGGVYIQLLKSDTSLSPDVINSIFQEECQQWRNKLREQRKIKKAARRKRKQQMKREMDIDRPETPTPAEDLEVLNALDSNSEFDNADLPERPATPEPKDDSSDGQDDEDEEENEEEDIAVAIAKAKAAILKKQRELANEVDADSRKLYGRSPMSSCHASGDGSDSGLKDNAMMEDADCKVLSNKVSDQDVIQDDRQANADVEIGEMEDA